ncbi:MAG: hypothetical protein RE471_03450 [Ferroplasma sp.]|uniref:hypothetical protein n=1 Tax=Ferroplasma sp. TaxID=2591003 RepID=UPI002814ACFE|nr:hypothetical protein [Ferroplasma sp.]WMT51941.1 MAG: hypothetical protein RE471_03450 [Ferroplasma sp.]
MDRLSVMVAAAIIFVPDFIMIFAMGDLIYTQTIVYFVLIFTAAFVLIKLLKVYGVVFFLLLILSVLLLYLKTLYAYTATISKYFFYLPDMPVSYKLILTVITLIIVFFVIQGLFSTTFWHVLSYYFAATGMLLMQMATLAYMRAANTGISTVSYLSSYNYIWVLEYRSIISLLEHGYQTYLPLYRLSLPLSLQLSAGFAISVIGSIFWLYVKDSKSSDNTAGSFSIVPGLIIGFIFFVFLRYFISVRFEFLYIAIAIVLVFILISYSNRKGRDISINIGGEQ